MKTKALLFAILLAFSLGAMAACDSSAPTSGVDLFHLKKLSLNSGEKQHVLELTKALLRGEKPTDQADRFPAVYASSPRGVLVSAPLPDERALTGFGAGDSLKEALTRAVAELKALGKGRNLSLLPPRVDIMNTSSPPKTKIMSNKLKLDFTLKGIIFGTQPLAVFLPHEIRDYGIFTRDRKRKKYSLRQMRKLIRARGMESALVEQLKPGQEVPIARFSTISFTEGEDGQYRDMYRGNLRDGYDPSPERLLRAINAAGGYLAQAVKEDGEFEYRYYPQTDSFSKSYNLLRHAGTTFAMAQIYALNKDPELLESIQRALGFLVRTSKGPDAADAEKYDWKAVVNEKGQFAKLGGCGLALLAFGTYTQNTGDQQYLPLMQAYARFIEYMQKDNGHMRQRYWYRPKDKGRYTKPVLYYPGEAFFGLSKLYALDGDMRWMKVVEKGIDYIADVRDAKTATEKLEHDHWMMYAINEMNKVKVKENHTGHAGRVVEAMLGRFNFKSKHIDFIGGTFQRPSTTPAACRLEGKAAQYEMAVRMGDRELAEKIYIPLELGAGFLMRNQYNPTNTIFFKNPQKPIGSYMASYWKADTQIDYTQHATSALIAIREIMLERQQAAREQKPAA